MTSQWILCTERTPEPQPGPGQGGWHCENRDSRPVLLAVRPVGHPDDLHQEQVVVAEAVFRQAATVDPDGEPYDLSDEDDINDAQGGWFGRNGWGGESNYTRRALAWQPFPSTSELLHL